MTQKINFSKKEGTDAIQVLKATGMKLGLKRIDDWLEKGMGNQEEKFIRVKVNPFELSLNGEKRKVKVIDFFINVSAEIILTKQLENNKLFALRWEDEEVGEGIGFATNRPHVLVVYTNLLDLNNHEKYEKNRKTEDIEINWKNVVAIDSGAIVGEEKLDSFVFDIFPQTYSVNGNNFIFNKIFWFPRMWGIDTVSKEKIIEWKAALKPLILEKVNIGDNDWFSVEEGNYLVVSDYENSNLEDNIRWGRVGKEKDIELMRIPGWERLPGEQKRKFRKEIENKEWNDLKTEITNAIQALGNSDNQEESNNNQNNSTKTNFPDKFPQKVIIAVSLASLMALVVGIVIFRKRRK